MQFVLICETSEDINFKSLSLCQFFHPFSVTLHITWGFWFQYQIYFQVKVYIFYNHNLNQTIQTVLVPPVPESLFFNKVAGLQPC